MDATCRCEHPLVGFKFGMGLRCRLCNNQLDLEAFERSRTADQKQADANVTALSNEVLRLRSTLSEAENQIAGLVNELDREREVSGKLRVALEAQVAALTAERDDARAWAAAWKRAAKWWWLAARDGSKHGMMNAWYRCEAKARRARRAAEFVETMEQR